MLTQERNAIYFRSEEHRERFREAIQHFKNKAVYKNDHIDQYYGPALLLLTLDRDIREDVRPYITRNGIFFEEFLVSRHFSTTERTMMEFAAHLFNESNPSPTITDLVPLDSRNFEVCVMALRMRRNPYQLADIEPIGGNNGGN